MALWSSALICCSLKPLCLKTSSTVIASYSFKTKWPKSVLLLSHCLSSRPCDGCWEPVSRDLQKLICYLQTYFLLTCSTRQNLLQEPAGNRITRTYVALRWLAVLILIDRAL